MQAKGVFDGIDLATTLDQPALQYGTKDADTLEGTGASDNMHGALGDDTMDGAAGADFLFGEGGHDSMSGGADNDWLEAGWGRDTMDGGAGEDVLVSTAGRDMMTGGDDADRFVFKDKIREATITDWQDGIDLIDLVADGRSRWV